MVRLRLPKAMAVDLEQALEDLLAQAPRGRVTTYGALAVALGDRRAAIWVARHLLRHAHDGRCGCHRAVRAGGVLVARPPARFAAQVARLTAEGVAVREGRVDLARHGVMLDGGGAPMARLEALQTRMSRQVRLTPLTAPPRWIGGVDVSYRGAVAVASFTLVNARTRQLAWSHTVARPVRFPYIPGYLSFRELPVLVELLNEVGVQGRLPDVLLVDGTGILHPRRLGIAAHLGLIADLPTIGVAKKLLAGRPTARGGAKTARATPVLAPDSDEQLGWALRATPTARTPLYVSPGHRVDLNAARRVVLRMLVGRRLPEPLYWADRLSRQEARRGP